MAGAAIALAIFFAASHVLAALQEHLHRPPWDAEVASTHLLHVGDTELQVDFSPGSPRLSQQAALHWVQNAATAVSTYYGHFPVARDRILVQFVPGTSGVFHGTTWGAVDGFPAFTRIHVGEQSTQQDLDDDWMMTHELVHTAFPSMEDDHPWIEEGLAVYVEPIARVQAGLLTPEKIWGDMMRDMSKGDPESGDEGLDRTHSWGRTYWGGAQFCLIADVTIRRETHNSKGLQDALKGILQSEGAIDQNRSITQVFEAGDRATGTHVLINLYNETRDRPKQFDLESLWQQLGVVRVGESVRLDDGAPLAAIRRALTMRQR